MNVLGIQLNLQQIYAVDFAVHTLKLKMMKTWENEWFSTVIKLRNLTPEPKLSSESCCFSQEGDDPPWHWFSESALRVCWDHGPTGHCDEMHEFWQPQPVLSSVLSLSCLHKLRLLQKRQVKFESNIADSQGF